MREKWSAGLKRLAPLRILVVAAYAVFAFWPRFCCLAPLVGRELFPRAAGGQFRLRFDAPTGTRAEETAHSW